MSEKLAKRIDEMLSLSVGTPSYTNVNAGNNIDKHIEKYPFRSGGELGMHVGGFQTRDEIASQTLPFPLEHSVDELVSIYAQALQYRKKLKEAMRNPQVTKSKKKMRILRYMRRRMATVMKMIRIDVQRLDALTLEAKPLQQIGREERENHRMDQLEADQQKRARQKKEKK